MAINYVDVYMAFATLVAFSVVAPWVSRVLGMAQSAVDPLSAVLMGLILPLLLISLLYSMGESAKQ
jgi:hypothetical protein